MAGFRALYLGRFSCTLNISIFAPSTFDELLRSHAALIVGLERSSENEELDDVVCSILFETPGADASVPPLVPSLSSSLSLSFFLLS